MTAKQIGLYFGSFNPIHFGHLSLCDYLLAEGDVDEVWLVVSPANPLKAVATLADENDRLAMARLAIANRAHIEVCDVEFHLPRPSYTIDTMRRLKTLYPDCTFTLLIGADNVATFDRWKEANLLRSDYSIVVYPRRDYEPTAEQLRGMTLISAPLFDISSTEIRQKMTNKQSLAGLLPDDVIAYIAKKALYQ